MKPCVFLMLYWLSFVSLAFGNLVCPKCNYPNADQDRYCEECASELRPWTPEDHKDLPKPAPEPLKSPLLSKELPKRKLDEQPSHDFKPPLFCIHGKQVELGMSKALLRNRLDPETFSDRWHFDSGPLQSWLNFENDTLQSWARRAEIRENWDISKDLLDLSKLIKKGMSDKEVSDLLGKPHVEEESYSLAAYSLKWTFYLKADALLRMWSAVPSDSSLNEPKDSESEETVPTVIISFDNRYQVMDVQFLETPLNL